MRNLLKSVLAPIFSLAIFVLGNGLFNTFISVRMGIEGYSNSVIGGIAAAYAVGIVVGSRYCDRWIAQVGHIRAFAAFASATAASIMLMGLILNPWMWVPMRFAAGVCCAGLYIVVESWLLHTSSPKNRGSILSVYMIAFYLAQGGGQLLLNLGDPSSILLFCIPVLLISSCIWPVSMTKSPSPPNPEVAFMSLIKLAKLAPVGVLSCLAGGLIVGSFYSLGPIFVQGCGLPLKDVALAMAVTIVGGFSLQWPFGRLSDIIDRRIVIAMVSMLTAVAALFLVWFGGSSPPIFIGLVAVFGGFSFTLYPLGISHTSDRIEPHELVSTTASLLLVFGVGSIIGPLVAPRFMSVFGPGGLMIFSACAALGTAGYSLWRIPKREATPADEKMAFISTPRTGPLSAEFATEDDLGERAVEETAPVVGGAQIEPSSS